ncbi:iron-containing alcohol dehydrogenase [Romboutsia sp.]|uniref:iron-containing alcohol dehydrogenase n=1 Tax=Romboutsia sp. TaxID=1965302 RepID=UPI003F323292
MEFVTKVMTPIDFAPGALDKVGEKAAAFGATSVLIVSDEMIIKLGLVDKIIDSLENFGLEYVVFDKVLPDPPSYLVMEAAELAKENDCDCIVGIGGGSSMDVAKMTKLMTVNEGNILEYCDPQKKQLIGPKLICIPTTSGTGSEITGGAMVTDVENDRKLAVSGVGVLSDLALIDPELAMGMPPKLTAATGFDALSHAVEEYMSAFANGMSDVLAEKAIRSSVKYLKVAYEDGKNLEARSEMARASAFAGLAMNYCGLIAGHNLAHPLGAHYHIPHGVACAITLPFILEFIAPVTERKTRELIELFNGDPNVEKEKLGETIRELVIDLVVSVDLPLLHTFENVKEEDFEQLAKDANADLYGFLTPRTISTPDYLELYKKMYLYRR